MKNKGKQRNVLNKRGKMKNKIIQNNSKVKNK